MAVTPSGSSPKVTAARRLFCCRRSTKMPEVNRVRAQRHWHAAVSAQHAYWAKLTALAEALNLEEINEFIHLSFYDIDELIQTEGDPGDHVELPPEGE